MPSFNFKEYCRVQFGKTNDTIKLIKNVITNIKDITDYLPRTNISTYYATCLPSATWTDKDEVVWHIFDSISYSLFYYNNVESIMITILNESGEEVELEFNDIAFTINPDNDQDASCTGRINDDSYRYTLNIKTMYFDEEYYMRRYNFIANCAYETRSYPRTYGYFEIVNIKYKTRTVTEVMSNPYLSSLAYKKLTGVPTNVKELAEDDSIVLKYDHYFSLYEDISPFVVSNRDTYNYFPAGSVNTWDNVNTVEEDESGNLRCFVGRHHKHGGKGIKFTLSPGQSVEAWIKMGAGPICELKTEDNTVLDMFYSTRYHIYGDSDEGYYWFNTFNFSNNTTEDVLYYIVFSVPDRDYFTNGDEVYDVKLLLIENTVNDRLLEMENPVDDGALTSGLAEIFNMGEEVNILPNYKISYTYWGSDDGVWKDNSTAMYHYIVTPISGVTTYHLTTSSSLNSNQYIRITCFDANNQCLQHELIQGSGSVIDQDITIPDGTSKFYLVCDAAYMAACTCIVPIN